MKDVIDEDVEKDWSQNGSGIVAATPLQKF